MSKVDFAMRLSPDKDALVLTVKSDGEDRLQTFWSAAEVEGLIKLLAKLRTDMIAEVDLDHHGQASDSAPIDPSYVFEKTNSEAGYRLSLRHPGIGWTDWDISKDHLKKMMFSFLNKIKTD